MILQGVYRKHRLFTGYTGYTRTCPSDSISTRCIKILQGVHRFYMVQTYRYQMVLSSRAGCKKLRTGCQIIHREVFSSFILTFQCKAIYDLYFKVVKDNLFSSLCSLLPQTSRKIILKKQYPTSRFFTSTQFLILIRKQTQ